MEVRAATEADVGGIVRLQMDRNGPETEAMIHALLAHPAHGPACFTVAVHDGQVVSSLCLMAGSFRLEDVTIPVGQPEFVATTPGFEHRGLVREQMGLVHRCSRERGDLTQIIAGIPYFYRRFGYEYALPFPRIRLVNPGVALPMPAGWAVRRAEDRDIDAVVELERRVQHPAALKASRDDGWWRWWLQVEKPSAMYVAERDGAVEGSASLGGGGPAIGDSVTLVSHVALAEAGALWALLSEAANQGKPVAIEERRGLASLADGVSHRHPRRYSLYVRVPDPVALLDRIRPVLSARLARSALAGSAGRLLLSLYASSINLVYEDGDVVGVEAGPPEQDPVGKGGAGVPPDLVATLIYGRYGAQALAERHDDVRLGPVADIMETLFPRIDADIVTPL